jgi:hypothetical protein
MNYKDKINFSTAREYVIFLLLGIFIQYVLIFKLFTGMFNKSTIGLPIILSLSSLIIFFGVTALFQFNNILRRVALSLIILLNAVPHFFIELIGSADYTTLMLDILIIVVILCIVLKICQKSVTAREYVIFLLLGVFFQFLIMVAGVYIKGKVFILNDESAMALPLFLPQGAIFLTILFWVITLFKFNDILRRITLSLIILLNAAPYLIMYLTDINKMGHINVMVAILISVVVLCIILKVFQKKHEKVGGLGSESPNCRF